MKVVLVNTDDGRGGASIAARRLLTGLHRAHIDARLYVRDKQDPNDRIVCRRRSRFGARFPDLRKKVDLQPIYSLHSGRKRVPYSLNWVPERHYREINRMAPELVNLHWVNAGFIRIESLQSIEAPMVWTFHDMWPFTGGCHYSEGCEKYKSTCGACPILKSRRGNDMSRWVLERKIRAWRDLNITVVCPSRWLASKVRSSRLFGDMRVKTIPNGLDTEQFKPTDAHDARRFLGLPCEKRLILFGCSHGINTERKGLHLLKEALKHFNTGAPGYETQLVVFGDGEAEQFTKEGLRITSLGVLNDDRTLSLAYSAADVFVAASLEDNLPNTVMEALACGTPCVAFHSGGIPEMIDHRENGYLAEYLDTRDLFSGIHWVVEDKARLRRLSLNARATAVTRFADGVQAVEYRALFEKILQRQ